MSTSVVIVSYPHTQCEYLRWGSSRPCERDARFTVVKLEDSEAIQKWKVCYRHRWRMRDRVQDEITIAAGREAPVSSSKPA
jgi:hypothetical protein